MSRVTSAEWVTNEHVTQHKCECQLNSDGWHPTKALRTYPNSAAALADLLQGTRSPRADSGLWVSVAAACLPACAQSALSCASGAQWERAAELFQQMQQHHCMPDVVTYTALIGAYEKGHQWRQALQVTSFSSFLPTLTLLSSAWQPAAVSPGNALLLAEAASDLHCSCSGPACMTWTAVHWAAPRQHLRADDASARMAQHVELADSHGARNLALVVRAQHVCGKSHRLLPCHRCLRTAAGHDARLTPFCTPPSSTRCGRLASCGHSSTLHPFSSKPCCLTRPGVYQSGKHAVSIEARPLVAAAVSQAAYAAATSPPDSLTESHLQQCLHPFCLASLHFLCLNRGQAALCSMQWPGT